MEYLGINVHDQDPEYITEFSKTLLDGFYKRDDETIPMALARPAAAFCYGDYELAQRIYEYAYKGWFMYASPVLSNATKGKWVEDVEKQGKHYWYTSTFIAEEKMRGLPISCFAFDVPDTAQGQVEAIQELATLSMSGGGTGAHLSIRGVGGKAVGNIPYQKVMDSAIGYFRQQNRRGAIASYLNVNHPDIIEHINFRKVGGDAKRRSDNRQQYHSAVNITDEFIAAVESDSTYPLVCPHSGRVYEELRAREVWEIILENRALTGEPYLLKIDEANRRLPETQKAKGLKIRGSNLCVAPETQILTSSGYSTISELEGKQVNVWNGEDWSEVTIQKTSEESELITVELSCGRSLTCTKEHKFYKHVGSRKEKVEIVAKKLEIGDKLIKLETPVIQGIKTLDKAYQNGFYSGDGCRVKDKSRIYLYDAKKDLLPLFDVAGNVITSVANRLSFTVNGLEEKYFVPNANYTTKSRLDWFAGLLDSDGCLTNNQGTQSLQICSIHPEFLREVQLMLQTLGVQSKVVHAMNAGLRKLPKNDGTGDSDFYACKKSERLLIAETGTQMLLSLGMTTHRLKPVVRKPNRDCIQFSKVVSITDNGRKDSTYCFTEPKKHMGVFNGVLTGQCSEILLPTDETRTFVCCLSSLNLEKFEEWKNSKIVEDLIRFLDNVLQSFIDNAPNTLAKARFSAKSERALGLGTLGFHSYLQSKGIPLEGAESLNNAVTMTERLFGLIKRRAVEESKRLAVERGEPDDMIGTGLRNSRLMAVAPNSNSASILNTSPSIEPYFRNIFLQSSRAGNFTVKNGNLEKLLDSYGKNTDDVWKSIQENEGRVNHLDFLTELEKKVYATAMEIDQHWLIEIAEARGLHVCQTSSLNLFFPYGSSRKYVNSVHRKFLHSKNVLTLYYFRTEREGNIDIAQKIERKALVDWQDPTKSACLSCEG